MNQMEFAVASVATQYIQDNNHELMDRVKELNSRYLKIYEAYTRIQMQEQQFLLPLEAGYLKNYGFSHKEIINYISDFNNKDDNFYKEKCKEFEKRLSYYGLNQKEIESFQSTLKSIKIDQTPLYANDLTYRLYQELSSRFIGGKEESGSVGANPLAILNIIKDQSTPNSISQFRTRMYFLYRSNSLINEIMKDPELVAKINTELTTQGNSWNLDSELIESIRKEGPHAPLFTYGAYAAENKRSNLRSWNTPEQIENLKQSDPNYTYSEAEKAAKDKVIHRRYATDFTSAEHLNLLGEIPHTDRRDPLIKKMYKTSPSTNNSTSYLETPLEYKKRTTKIDWMPGKYVFDVKNVTANNRSAYMDTVRKLGLPIIAGISGTTDQSLVMAGIVGMNSKEDLINMRLCYIAWMVSSDDHSLHEIMESSKSFNLEYSAGIDSYKYIYPNHPEFIKALEEEMEKRGFKLPDYYLSENHFMTKLEEMNSSSLQEPKKNKFKNWKKFGLIHQTGQYERAQVDTSNIKISSKNRKKIEKECLKDYETARQILEHSTAETALDLIRNDPSGNPSPFMVKLRELNKRYLDLYDVYVDIKAEQNPDLFPLEMNQLLTPRLAKLKSLGLSFEKISAFSSASKWYVKWRQETRKELIHRGLTEETVDTFVNYLKDHDLNAANQSFISPEYKQVLSALKKDNNNIELLNLFHKYLSSINSDEINNFDDYILELSTLDKSKESIKDHNYRLYQELRQRFEPFENEAGSVGASPLAILNVIRKTSQTDEIAEFRTRMYFLYRSNTLANEIMSSPKLLKEVNKRLIDKGWQLEEDLIKFIRKKTSLFSLFQKNNLLFIYGNQASHNYTGYIRKMRNKKLVDEQKIIDPNMTIAEMEILSKSTSTKRYRTHLTAAETMHILGDHPKLEKRDEEIVNEYTDKPHADTSYLETPLDYAKKTTRPQWSPGKHFYELKYPVSSKYAQIAKKEKYPLIAGISGTVDQSLTMCGIAGFYTKKDLEDLRLMYLAWMVPSEDHSVHEIMQSSKTFGLEYNPAPDISDQILPSEPNFPVKVAMHQNNKGYQMPSYYLSSEYALKKAKDLGLVE